MFDETVFSKGKTSGLWHSSGLWHFSVAKRGKQVVHATGPTREFVLGLAKAFLLHELVRRRDGPIHHCEQCETLERLTTELCERVN